MYVHNSELFDSEEMLKQEFENAFQNGALSGHKACEAKISQAAGTESFSIFQQECKNKFKSTHCHNSWDQQTFAIHCKQCGISQNSCICIKCYLNGDHKGHDTFISKSIGTCDCGDDHFWDPDHFCVNHRHNNDEISLPSSLSSVIFIAITAALQDSEIHLSNLVLNYQWIYSFFDLGSPIKNVIIQATISYFNSENIFRILQVVNTDQTESFSKLMTSLFNEHAFADKISLIFYDIFDKIQSTILTASARSQILSYNPPWSGLTNFMTNSFHMFSPCLVKKHFLQGNFQWDQHFFNFFNNCITFLKTTKFYSQNFIDQSWIIDNYLPHILKLLDKKDRALSLIKSISSSLLTVEGMHYINPLKTAFAEPNQISKLIFDFQFSAQQSFYILSKIPGSLFESLPFLLQHILENDAPICPILSKNGGISNMLFLHVFVSQCLTSMNNFETSKSTFTSIIHSFIQANSSQFKVTPIRLSSSPTTSLRVTDIITLIAIEPLKHLYITALITLQNNIFENTPLSWNNSQVLFAINPKINFMHYCLIQACLGFSTDKNSFLLSMAKIFGIIDNDIPYFEFSEFIFFYFLSILIFDRTCSTGQKIYSDLLSLNLNLQDQNMPLGQYLSFLNTRTEFHDYFNNITKRVTVNDSVEVTLSDDAPPSSYIIPTAFPLHIKNKISNFMDSHPDTLPSLPLISLSPSDSISVAENDPTPKPFNLIAYPIPGLSLNPTLFSPVLFAFIYRHLSNHLYSPFLCDKVTLPLALHLFLSASQLSQSKPDLSHGLSNGSPYFAPTISDLIDLFAKHCGFGDIVTLSVSFSKRPPLSLAELIEKTGGIGEHVLESANIHYRHHQLTPSELSMQKANVASIKNQIIEQFRKQAENFAKTDLPPFGLRCNICRHERPNEIMFFPVAVQRSIIPYIVKFQDYESFYPKERYYLKRSEQLEKNLQKNSMEHTVYVVYGCGHRFHAKCHSSKVQCPICGAYRNSLLPIYDPSLSPEYVKACNDFIKNNSMDILSTMESHIAMLEIRARKNPSCLLDPSGSCRAITSALFRCFSTAKQELKFFENSDFFKDFLTDLISSFDPLEVFLDIALKYALVLMDKNQTDEKKMKKLLLIYLRRVALTQHFALDVPLGDKSDSLVDWEIELSPEKLLKRYGVKLNNEEFEHLEPWKPLIGLPHNFFSLLLSPYEIDVTNAIDLNAICLVTGLQVSLQFNNLENIFNMTHRMLGGTVSLFLITSGKFAGGVYYFWGKDGNFISSYDCYFNKFGEINYGFSDRQEIFLDQEKLDLLYDDLISGKWMDNIKKN